MLHRSVIHITKGARMHHSQSIRLCPHFHITDRQEPPASNSRYTTRAVARPRALPLSGASAIAPGRGKKLQEEV